MLRPVHGHRQDLKRWEKEYNQDRPYLVLEGETSAKRVCELGYPKSDILSLWQLDHPPVETPWVKYLFGT
jgi:hypothetical protein